jgi:hypothetical protein
LSRAEHMPCTSEDMRRSSPRRVPSKGRFLAPSALRRNAARLAVVAACLAAWACSPTTETRPPASAPPASSAAPPHRTTEAKPALGTENATSALTRWGACVSHWSDDCAGLASRLRKSCPLPTTAADSGPPCANMIDMLESMGARVTCSEGSIAECRAACDKGKGRECLELAKIYRSGARVPKDEERALQLTRDTCEQGLPDACIQHGVWLRETDGAGAASSFMRGCAKDAVIASVACALWFDGVSDHRYSPPRPELIAGLERVCARERKGDLRPGSLILSGEVKVRYEGGACGRLKDMAGGTLAGE